MFMWIQLCFLGLGVIAVNNIIDGTLTGNVTPISVPMVAYFAI
jgi:hypothetical protein